MTDPLGDYRTAASTHAEATRAGDHERANSAYGLLDKALGTLAEQERQDSLFTLYDDDEPYVQLWAASHTLELDEPRALSKLEELESAGLPLVSLGAKHTRKAWLNGELS